MAAGVRTQVPQRGVRCGVSACQGRQISGQRLEILQGSFYTAIYRLERQGWIKGEWGESENNRRARFYSLTAAGTRQLKAETAKWTDMAAVVASILDKKAHEI